jgi:hypothetical protein
MLRIHAALAALMRLPVQWLFRCGNQCMFLSSYLLLMSCNGHETPALLYFNKLWVLVLCAVLCLRN